MNQLKELEKNTIITLDSTDLHFIKKNNIKHVTTNPTLILKSLKYFTNNMLFQNSIKYGKKKGGNKITKIINARDKLIINISKQILKKISGKISVEIDITFAFNTEMSIIHAKKIIKLFQEEGIHHSRILIKIPATWEGIQAAQELKKDNIQCNLTLVFSCSQAKACADAQIFLISPFVGRIYDWYNKNNSHLYNTKYDKGVNFVKKIFKQFKYYEYTTKIMGASFRNFQQVLELNGCDYLTIPKNIFKQLQNCTTKISKPLFYNHTNNKLNNYEKLSESEFRWKHNNNKMAVQLLSQGIRKFFIDQKKLEKIISNKI